MPVLCTVQRAALAQLSDNALGRWPANHDSWLGLNKVCRIGFESPAGYSVQPNKVIVDLSSMTAVTLNASTGRATIQAGAKLGPIYKVCEHDGCQIE